MSSKRRRAPKTLVQQYERYVEYLEKYPDFRTGICHPNRLKLLWRDLTIELNAMGVERTPMEWKHAFQHWKHNTRYMVRKMNLVPGKYRKVLTSLEERMLSALDGHVLGVLNVDDPPPTHSETNTTIVEEIEDELKNNEKLLKKRAPKTLLQQYDRYVQYIEQRPHFRTGECDPEQLEQLWKNLTIELNAMGVERTTMEWKNVFQHWKHNTRYLVRKMNLEPGKYRKILTPLEKRMLFAFDGHVLDSSDIGNSTFGDEEIEDDSKNIGKWITKRAPKTLAQQYERYVEYLEKSPDFRAGKCDPKQLEQWWMELTVDLNAMGVERTTMEWRHVFQRWKNQTRYLVRKRNLEDLEHGEHLKLLTSLEERMLCALDGHVLDGVLNDADSQPTHSETITTIDEEIEDELENNETLLKKRAPKTRMQQYERYVEYLERNPLFKFDFGETQRLEKLEQLWLDLSGELNSMGVKRTIAEWRNVFRKWKYQTCYIARKLKNPELYGMDASRKCLTPLEDRLLNTYGRDVLDGNGIGDSTCDITVGYNHRPHSSRKPITVVHPKTNTSIDEGMEESGAEHSARHSENQISKRKRYTDFSEVNFANEDTIEDDENDVKRVSLMHREESNANDCILPRFPGVLEHQSVSLIGERNVLADDLADDGDCDQHSEYDDNEVNELQSNASFEQVPNKTAKMDKRINGVIGSKSVDTALVSLSNDVCDIKFMFRNMLRNQERIIRLLENRM